jgi:HK97 family phage prohead protease
MQVERRFNPFEIRTVRSSTGNSPGTLIGYAARFNTLSSDLGGWREKILPGAFAKSIRTKAKVVALINHDPHYVLGSTEANTLRLSEDSRGLKFSVDLPPVSYAKDLVENVNLRNLHECSFAFTADEQSFSEEPNPDADPSDRNSQLCQTRILHSVTLIDVSCVLQPAYPSTSVEVKYMQLNSMPTSIPEAMPVEMRSRIIASQRVSSAGKEARKRLFHFVLGL